MKPYRRRLVGLPLQRSLFVNIANAPLTIGMLGVLPGDRLSAWLDENGDLYFDRAEAEQLSAALAHLATPEFLASMEENLVRACSRVDSSTVRVSENPPENELDVRRFIADLGRDLANLIPYGILSKFIPDALYQAAKAAGDDREPPFPRASPGVQLTQNVTSLYHELRAAGYSVTQLRSDWPDVPESIASQIRGFCFSPSGFGPLAWEAAGFEDPRYLLDLFARTFGDGDAPPLRTKGGEVSLPASAGDTPLRRALAEWLSFLERETLQVRRAFYRGMLPLLQRLVPVYQQAHSSFVPEDLLFLELDELIAGRGMAEAPLRRARYLADREYFAKYGVTSGRLRTIMENL